METVHCYGGRRYGASQIMRYVCDDIGIGFGCILFLLGDFFVDIQPGDTEGCDGDNIIPGGGFYLSLIHILEYIDKIQISGKYLVSLINDILDVSKISEGAFEIAEKPMII